MMPQGIYPSPYVPVPNPYYPLGPNMGIPWAYTPNNVPVIKRYNISLGGPDGDITKLANLYEDILPSVGNVMNNTFNTLKERTIIHRYLRSIFIKTGDGEELYINGGPNNTKSEIINLLAHVKLLEINPYHYDKLTDNPYKTMPSNFVMYRSCYPIKMGKFNVVECSKSSIGMNVRIYLLTKYDEDINVSRLPRHNSDIWRELDYYQYVREEIVKPNISPNFITLHSYYMTKNTGINFKKFDLIKDQNQSVYKNNNSIRNNLYIKYIKDYYFSDPKEVVTIADLITFGIVPVGTPVRSITDVERRAVIDKRVDKLIKDNKLGHYLDSDKCLVMLTEAPTQHIFNWATRTYKVDNGPIKKMVQNGYHDDKVWTSIFFQLLLSELIMFQKKIMFTEFNLKNNVYIKDLNQSEQNIGVWKYIYNGIDYFVPNYGYLLLIDSNYSDITSNPNPLSPGYDPSKIKFKVQSTLLKDDNINGEIYKLCLDKMIESFDRDQFGISFRNYGGVPPSDNFLNKLDMIKIELTRIRDKHFGPGAVVPYDETELLKDIRNLPIFITQRNIFNMVHSRIGTPIKDQEKTYLSDHFNLDTKYGSIIVRKLSATFNTFAIYLGRNLINANYKILTTENPIYDISDRENIMFTEMEVDASNLLNYYIQPEQMYEPGKQTSILESYLISSASN